MEKKQLQLIRLAINLLQFDISQWLHSSNASLSERVALIDNIGAALCQCGQKPADKISAVFEVRRVDMHVFSVYVYHQLTTLHLFVGFLVFSVGELGRGFVCVL